MRFERGTLEIYGILNTRAEIIDIIGFQSVDFSKNQNSITKLLKLSAVQRVSAQRKKKFLNEIQIQMWHFHINTRSRDQRDHKEWTKKKTRRETWR